MGPTLKNESILRRNPDQLFSEIDSEIVMLSIEKGEYFNFNEVGSEIWKILVVPKTLNELIAELTGIYNVSFQQCSTDILKFVNGLLERELIIISNE